MNDKQTAFAMRLHLKMNRAEHRLDDAIEAAAVLFGELTAGRREAQVGAEIGQPAVEQLSVTMAALATARGHLTVTHKRLTQGAEAMHFDPFEPYEGEGNKPDHPTRFAAVPIAA